MLLSDKTPKEKLFFQLVNGKSNKAFRVDQYEENQPEMIHSKKYRCRFLSTVQLGEQDSSLLPYKELGKNNAQ